jgi:hypothetical protein
LGAKVEWVGFWGEVYSTLHNPTDTITQMGSGYKAEAGWSKACFQKNLQIRLGANGGLSKLDHMFA